MSEINDKAKTALFIYVDSIAQEQSTRVAEHMNEIRRACEIGDAVVMREATRKAVDAFIVLGRAADHAAKAIGLPRLPYPENRGLTNPLESLEADLGSEKGII